MPAPEAHVVREGEGEPLVLIHGVGHEAEGWRPVIDILRWEFDVIAVDSPGFGASPDLPGDDHSIEAYTDFYASFLEGMGLDRPHVAGNSMGGGIALELARRGLVSTAVAISPVGFWTDGERAAATTMLGLFADAPPAAGRLLARAARTRLGRALLTGSVQARPSAMPPDVAERLVLGATHAPAMRAALDDFAGYHFAHGEELDGTPVTVAWGSHDFLLYHWRQAPRAQAALPNARHVTLPGLGHTPFTDDPGLVAGVVRAGSRQA